MFVRARIKLADGREGEGVSAEMLAPKWFDKSPELSNEQNFDQLRRSLAHGAHAACLRPAPIRRSDCRPPSMGRITMPARRSGSTASSHRSVSR